MNCQEYRDIVSAHVDGTLSAQEEAEVRAHLDGCDQCTRIFRWEGKAAEAIKQKLSAQTIDPGVRNRILQTLEKESKRSIFSWSLNQYRLAATLALLLVAIASVLITRTKSSDDIFADIVAQHLKMTNGTVPMSNEPSRQSTDSFLDLRPWGYRLLARQPAHYDAIKGTTFLYGGAGKEYVLAQEFKGGTLSVPPGAKSIEASEKTFISYSLEGVNVVAWKDKDLLCILAAKLPQETLLQIAERLASTA
ncbi:MAG: anti-sigma factor [Candidatus Binatia bacterium]